jgi:hypothetical protein
MIRTSSWLLIAVALTACTSSASSPHPYDFVPGPEDVYTKNANVTLKREYWVIYAVEGSERYYTFPRADGAESIAAECAADGPKAATFKAAMLCETASSSAAVDRVNSLTKSEAIEASTFLHAHLKFRVDQDGTTIAPTALISDQVDVCNEYPDARAGALKAVCDRELGYVDSGQRPEIFVSFTPAEASALAPLLNDLYGAP